MIFDPPASLTHVLPPRIAAQIPSYGWQRVTLGRSSADIFKLVAEGRDALFLKSQPAGPFEALPQEAARADWLASHGVPCARVLALENHQGRDWLLTSAVPGGDLASSPELGAGQRVEILAEGLRRLHGLDVYACPFDQRLVSHLARAEARLAAGMVDEADFDEERQGETGKDLLDRLRRQQPSVFDLVVVHGDASFPNVMAKDGRFSGFVDLGRLGVADRYQDIALSSWSVRHNLGEEWVQPFLDHYGISAVDRSKLAYYKALDEFF